MEQQPDFDTFVTLMRHSGLKLTDEQLRSVFGGYAGLLGMLQRVNTPPMPRAIEPALTFDPVNVR